MRPSLRAAALAALVTLAGCGGGASSPSPSASPSPPPAQATSSAVAATPTSLPSSPLATGGQTAIATASGAASPAASIGVLHPCALLTAGEASQVNGAAYGTGAEHTLQASALPGVETTTPKSAECVWQSATHGASLTLQLVDDETPAAAKARLDTLRTSLHTFTINSLSSLADGAFIARVTASANSISTGGIYVAAGSFMFDIVYLGGSVPNDSTLQNGANLVLGSLP